MFIVRFIFNLEKLENEKNNLENEIYKFIDKDNQSIRIKLNHKGSKEDHEISKLKDLFRGEKPENLKIFRIICKKCNSNNINWQKNLAKIMKGEEILNYDLNIINILKRLIDVEMLKDILFDEKQLDLIKILYKRRINSVTEIKRYLMNLEKKHYQFKLTKSEFYKIEKSYENCISSDNIIDSRIIKFFQLNK